MPRRSQKPLVNAAEEREIAALGIRLRQLRSEKITAKDTLFLRRWQQETNQAICNEFIRAIPKGVYCQLAGRQQKVIDEFGARYDLPLLGPSIDLFAVIKTMHSRISELAAAARPYQDADEAELHREKLRQEIQKLERQSEVLRIDIQTRMSELVSREQVTDRLEWLSGQLQSLGARLYRVGGTESQIALNEFLEAMAIELEGGTLAV